MQRQHRSHKQLSTSPLNHNRRHKHARHMHNDIPKQCRHLRKRIHHNKSRRRRLRPHRHRQKHHIQLLIRQRRHMEPVGHKHNRKPRRIHIQLEHRNPRRNRLPHKLHSKGLKRRKQARHKRQHIHNRLITPHHNHRLTPKQLIPLRRNRYTHNSHRHLRLT